MFHIEIECRHASGKRNVQERQERYNMYIYMYMYEQEHVKYTLTRDEVIFRKAMWRD